MKGYEKTLAEFTSEIKANPPLAPGRIPIFETDEEIETQWLIEIEGAIDDGEEVPVENLAAFAAKPSDWLTR